MPGLGNRHLGDLGYSMFSLINAHVKRGHFRNGFVILDSQIPLRFLSHFLSIRKIDTE